MYLNTSKLRFSINLTWQESIQLKINLITHSKTLGKIRTVYNEGDLFPCKDKSTSDSL